MLRRSLCPILTKMPKVTYMYDLIPKKNRTSSIKLERNITSVAKTSSSGKESDGATSAGGGDDSATEQVMGRGSVQTLVANELKKAVESMDHPVVWVWYPWQTNPQPPLPALPSPNALKNLHGAIYTDLSPKQKRLEENMLYKTDIPASRDAQHDTRHPFLATVLKDLKGSPKGFPFWYKKYPTRRHAFNRRFNIPEEMLEGYPEPMKQALGAHNMSIKEREQAERALYIERYAMDALDTQSPAVVSVMLALVCRRMRNHLLSNPHNNVIKAILTKKEHQLRLSLRRLRKIDFRKYWEICRDHDVSEMLQPPNAISYRWGAYWQYDWNAGLALSTNIADFMDPRGLNGCVETGRSRAEVARDLGLSYTRPLLPNEKRMLAHNALYFERLAKHKAEEPVAFRERERQKFVNKFSAMFTKVNRKSEAVDFPSTYRRKLGVTVLRWKSCRHGPS